MSGGEKKEGEMKVKAHAVRANNKNVSKNARMQECKSRRKKRFRLGCQVGKSKTSGFIVTQGCSTTKRADGEDKEKGEE